MEKVFISYRHVKPDEDLAVQLAEFLGANGLETFIDRDIPIGTDWVREIRDQIRTSQHFVVFLSDRSVHSDMVRQEVAEAHELEARGSMRIFPVRIDYEDAAPYDLEAKLARFQYALWRQGDNFAGICDALLAQIRHPKPAEAKRDDGSASRMSAVPGSTSGDSAPLPAADVRVEILHETGTVRKRSPFYVERSVDARVKASVVRPGQTLIIRGPRQIGKSSLLARAHAAAKKGGVRSCYIDFQALDARQLTSLDTLLRYMAAKIGREFGATAKPTQYWDEFLGPKESITDFIESAILEEADSPLVVCLDEVDRVFDCSFRDDFFSAIRYWHNRRSTHEQWENWNIVIAHATEAGSFITDPNQSPFNVGEKFELEDFTEDQIEQLNQLHGNPLRVRGELEQLLELVGGHPFLVRQALYTMAQENMSIEALERLAIEGGSPFGDHLRRLLWVVCDREAFTESVRTILDRGASDDEKAFQILHGVGLVCGDTRREARMRCKLYERYFRKHL